MVFQGIDTREGSMLHVTIIKVASNGVRPDGYGERTIKEVEGKE
jgi:hypothetical protein